MPTWAMAAAALFCLLSLAARFRDYRRIDSQPWWTPHGRVVAKRTELGGLAVTAASFALIVFANSHWLVSALAWLVTFGYLFDAARLLVMTRPPHRPSANGGSSAEDAFPK